jgi:hypothetical protein
MEIASMNGTSAAVSTTTSNGRTRAITRVRWLASARAPAFG